MTSQHSLVRYVGRFFNHYLIIQRGLASNTLLAYRDTLKLFFCFAADDLHTAVDQLMIEDLNEERVLAFLTYLETKRGVTVRTRNARLAALRTFFKFIAREEPALLQLCQQIRTIPQKRTTHKQMSYLDEAEVNALLQSVDTLGRNGWRDKALLMLMFNTGARAQEVADLMLSDVRLDLPGQVTLLGKGRKERSCPLWPETVEALKLYIQHDQRKTDDCHLFLNTNDQPITRFGIRYIVKKYGTIAMEKIPNSTAKKLGPHTIRHSTAMHLIRAGNDINMVSLWLGHADINTTHIYVEIDLEMKRKMLGCSPTSIAVEDKAPKPQWKQDNVLKWLDSLLQPGKLCEASG